jgi:fatty-acyl-CoA synthase/long-chain acyl-CoA synthetase
MRLNAYYRKLLRRFGDRPAVVAGDRELSYRELDARTARLASAFRSMGLRHDRRVAVLMANRPEFVVTEIAAARAGVVCVPLNSQLDADNVRRVLADADASALVVGPGFIDVAREIQRELFDLRYIIAVCEDCDLPVGFQSYGDLLARETGKAPSVDPAPDDVASVFYTGGTTGPQKGVMHTHESLVLNAAAHIHELDVRRHERILLSTPLAHSANFVSRAGLAQGATLVLQPGFDSGRVLAAIEREEITWTFLVPTMLSRLLEDDRIESTTTSSIETVVYGASPMPPALVEEGIDRFGQVFVQVYGLMEAPDVVTTLHKHKHRPREGAVLNTVGYPTQYADVRIAEESRWGEGVGEILVRAAFGMAGYHGRSVDGDEWIPTGDLGRLDEEGRLVVLDRIQDVIRAGEKVVFSTRVENVIQRHPSVRAVAVIGVPADHEATPIRAHRAEVDQSVKAVVSTVEGGQLALEGLREFCADQLAPHELPDSVDFVGDLPETPYGKPDKRSLRQPYW